jgi:carbamate kinase
VRGAVRISCNVCLSFAWRSSPVILPASLEKLGHGARQALTCGKAHWLLTVPFMGDRSQRLVIALGESAFSRSQSPDGEHQVAAALVHHLQPLLRSGAELVVTHGGGHLTAGRAESSSLEALVATSEGELGDVLATSLREELEGSRPVAVLLTHVRVDPTSAGFRRPGRPVGALLDESAARQHRRQGHALAEVVRGRSWRRLAPLVEPAEVLDVQVLRRLVETGVVVVAGGGGGIPVLRVGKAWRSAEAVVDQDLTASLVADCIEADELIIVTDVPNVFEDYGTPHEKPIGLVAVDQLRNLLAEGNFPPVTMAPKVEACVRFVSRPGRRAVICDPATLDGALAGQAGTRVVWPISQSGVCEAPSTEQVELIQDVV